MHNLTIQFKNSLSRSPKIGQYVHHVRPTSTLKRLYRRTRSIYRKYKLRGLCIPPEDSVVSRTNEYNTVSYSACWIWPSPGVHAAINSCGCGNHVTYKLITCIQRLSGLLALVARMQSQTPCTRHRVPGSARLCTPVHYVRRIMFYYIQVHIHACKGAKQRLYNIKACRT